jgi:SNF2 family DNA or RNA helicase
MQLPKKTDKVAFCPLSDAQIGVYKRFLGTPNIQNMLRRDEPCDCGSKKK